MSNIFLYECKLLGIYRRHNVKLGYHMQWRRERMRMRGIVYNFIHPETMIANNEKKQTHRNTKELGYINYHRTKSVTSSDDRPPILPRYFVS